MVAANLTPRLAHDGNQERTQQATLAAFGVGTDGKLVFARARDDKTDGKTSFGAEWWQYLKPTASAPWCPTCGVPGGKDQEVRVPVIRSRLVATMAKTRHEARLVDHWNTEHPHVILSGKAR